jgi:hypothetical protein
MTTKSSIVRSVDVARNVNPELRFSAPVSRRGSGVMPRRPHGAWLMLDPRGTYRRFVRRLLQAA